MSSPILSTPSLVHGPASMLELRPGYWVTECVCRESWAGPRARKSLTMHLAMARRRLAVLRMSAVNPPVDLPKEVP
jgi:hypothetical protein